ncbi:hypothetical protein L916_18597, partial [Phytophthora nicotianae]
MHIALPVAPPTTTATTAIPTVYEYDVSTHVLYTFNAVIATCAAVEGAMKWAQE